MDQYVGLTEAVAHSYLIKYLYGRFRKILIETPAMSLFY